MLFLKKNLVCHVLESSVKGDNCFSYTYVNMHCVVVAHLNLAIIYASQGRYADAEKVINISKNDKHIYC